jgi:hypothetical protein
MAFTPAPTECKCGLKSDAYSIPYEAMLTAISCTDARKYGQIPGSHKSGYTPLDYLFPAMITSEDAQRIKTVEEFQRMKFLGFTTRELNQLDAISSRVLKPLSLESGIIPLLWKDRWEKTPPTAFTRKELYPLSNGKGLWIMDNPEVERVMGPVLRLASRILMSTHILAWVLPRSTPYFDLADPSKA